VLDHFGLLLQRWLREDSGTSARPWVPTALTGAVLGGVVLISGLQNWRTYADTYMHSGANALVSLQAQYVHDRGDGYYYYDLGAYNPAATLYWGHGDNRFINPSALGQDVTSLRDVLPIVGEPQTTRRGVIFLIWQFGPQYESFLQTLQHFYPEGREQVVPTSTGSAALTAYIVPQRVILARRAVRAKIMSSDGRRVGRRQSALGMSGGEQALGRDDYPAAGHWDGGIVAAVSGSYRFRLTGSAASRLTIDGIRVMSLARAGEAHGAVYLGRGLHTIRLDAQLPHMPARVSLEWAPPGRPFGPVEREFLWDGPTPGLR
jgi:hypothetical protein